MAFEDVISDHDSEDEVDYDIADLEDCKVCLFVIWSLTLFVYNFVYLPLLRMQQ